MSGGDIHQLAAAYALDAVDERERAEFETHYVTCVVCRPEVAGYRETLAHVAAATAVPPRESLKAEVMAEIGVTRQLSPLVPDAVADLASFRRRRQRSSLLLAAAAVMLLVAGGAFFVGRRSHQSDGYATAVAAVLARPDARVVNLDGTGSGTFKVAWSPSAGRAVVIGTDLTKPGSDKAYELWRIDADGAHAMRLLDKAGDGHIQRVLDVSGSALQWAVTVEPEEGADEPTGEIVYSGAA
jgi:anti-sigma-K factor RskA